jgi:chemotaxis family two-component system response regulator Rcp1
MKHQILVVEDNQADVYLIRKAIEATRLEATIHVVRDGRAASQFFENVDRSEQAPCPDLVLLDLNLPKRNGDVVLRDLRNSRRCRNALVLVVTSSDSQRDRDAVAAFGVIGYFRKPSDYTEFMRLGELAKAALVQR